MKIDSSILLKKRQKAPILNLKSIRKNNKKQFVGFYYKPLIKNFNL